MYGRNVRVEMISVEPRLVESMPGLMEKHPAHFRKVWYGGLRYVMLLDYLDHCGNVPGYCVSWTVPEELEYLAASYFKPVVALSLAEARRIAQRYNGRPACPTRWSVLLDGGVKPQEFSEVRGSRPWVASVPGKTLWITAVQRDGDKFHSFALPLAPQQWKRSYWKTVAGRITPRFDECVSGTEGWRLDDSTAWLHTAWAEGRAKLAQEA